MKTLKTLLEGLLQGQDTTIKETIDLNLIYRSTTREEFNSNAQLIKAVIENEGKGPFSHKQLKNGKSYTYIFYDDWADDGWVVAFVDKYPKQDPKTDFNDDTYYVIFWDDYINSVSCRYDNTGNIFTGLLEQDFGKDSMKGAYETPNAFKKSMKEIIKDATGY